MKKRKGNITIVILLLLLIFPAILILSEMGGSSLKILTENVKYHQEMLTQESVLLLAEDLTVTKLKALQFNMTRDFVIDNGVTIYGPYYIPANTQISISTLIDAIRNKPTLKTVFGFDTVDVLNITYPTALTGLSNKNLPFQFSMPIKYTLRLKEGTETYDFNLETNVTLTLSADTTLGKAYVSNVVINDIDIID